jgi:hypothetical protein
MSDTTTIDTFEVSTAPLDEAEVIEKLKAMQKRAEQHGHECSLEKGDGQHAKDLIWKVKKKGKIVMQGSIPMTAHTRGNGSANMKPARRDINAAIDYLNEL